MKILKAYDGNNNRLIRKTHLSLWLRYAKKTAISLSVKLSNISASLHFQNIIRLSYTYIQPKRVQRHRTVPNDDEFHTNFGAVYQWDTEKPRGYQMLLTPSRIHPCVFDSLLWNYQVSLKKTDTIFINMAYQIPSSQLISFEVMQSFLDKDNAYLQPSAIL